MGGAASGSTYEAAIEQYCGLEAEVTDPSTGKTAKLYIGDSFAHPPTEGSIDIMLGAFTALNGNPNQNKDIVIKNAQWKLTGGKNPQYSAKGPGGNGGGSTTTTSGSTGGPGSSGSGSEGASPTTLLPSPSSSKYSSSSSEGGDSRKTSKNSGPDCTWGCWGWDCSVDVPCQGPWTCKGSYCK